MHEFVLLVPQIIPLKWIDPLDEASAGRTAH